MSGLAGSNNSQVDLSGDFTRVAGAPRGLNKFGAKLIFTIIELHIYTQNYPPTRQPVVIGVNKALLFYNIFAGLDQICIHVRIVPSRFQRRSRTPINAKKARAYALMK